MTRPQSWWPRQRRFVLVLLACVVLGVVGVLLLARTDARLSVPGVGWKGLEQASWIAGIVTGVLAIVMVVLPPRARRGPRRAAAPAAPAAAEPVQVGVIPPRAAWFLDRDVRGALRPPAAGGGIAPTQVLSGAGGVGKTQLAAQFARDLRDRGELDLLVWITVTDRHSIPAGYAAAAIAVSVADRASDPERAAAAFVVWLERTDRRWLLVLDDLDDPAHARGWWPPAGRHGRTLITSRRRDAVFGAGGRTLTAVHPFSVAEGVACLTRAIEDRRRLSGAGELVEDLGGLPLAVAQAAALIRDRHLDCAGYRRHLLDERRYLAERLPPVEPLPHDHRATVAATWSLAIDLADRTDVAGVARPVFGLAAMLDPSGVPVTVFSAPAALRYVADEAGAAVDERAVDDALRRLDRLNLLTHDRAAGIRVHALVQFAARDDLAPEALTAVALAAAAAVLEVWPPPGAAPAVEQAFRDNTQALRGHAPDALWYDGADPLLFRAGRSLGEAGLAAPAAGYFERLAAEAAGRLGADHPDTLAARHDVAHWTGQAGNLVAAMTAFERLLPDRVRVLGPDHPDTLETRGNLARWRGHAGDPHGAVADLERLTGDYARTLGPDHPATLTSRHHLARWRGHAGDPGGAVRGARRLLPDRERVLGPDHPDTLDTRHDIARWTGAAGDPDLALRLSRELLPDRIRVLGPDHPDTLTTRGGISNWLRESGRPAEAAAVAEELLADRERVLDKNHPDTLASRDDLAQCRGEAGYPAEALHDLEALLPDRLRVLGPEHPDTMATVRSIASWRALVAGPDGNGRPGAR